MFDGELKLVRTDDSAKISERLGYRCDPQPAHHDDVVIVDLTATDGRSSPPPRVRRHTYVLMGRSRSESLEAMQSGGCSVAYRTSGRCPSEVGIEARQPAFFGRDVGNTQVLPRCQPFQHSVLGLLLECALGHPMKVAFSRTKCPGFGHKRTVLAKRAVVLRPAPQSTGRHGVEEEFPSGVEIAHQRQKNAADVRLPCAFLPLIRGTDNDCGTGTDMTV